jgi:CRP-like cAMP-binding protein
MKEQLRNFVESFGFLTKDEIDIIVQYTVLKKFNKGDFLLKEGEVSKECFSIIKGCIRTYKIVDGIEKTTSFFVEGEPVNTFSSSANNEPSEYFVECLEDCILTVGNESLIDDMCERIPRLNKFIRMEVEKEAGKYQERVASFISSSPQERFVELLETNSGLINRVPQIHIASYIGVTPESYSRIKKRVFDKIKAQN